MRNVFEMQLQIRIELDGAVCCALQSVHIRHIHFYLYLFISLFLILFSTSLPPLPPHPCCTPFNCLPMSRKRATTSFLSKTKNQIENDRTLSFSISRSFQWKLLGELSRRRGWGHAVSTRHSHLSKQVPTVGGREREKERGRWSCLFVVIVREGKAASTNFPHTDTNSARG